VWQRVCREDICAGAGRLYGIAVHGVHISVALVKAIVVA
jgi:hypothetical protein